MDFVNLFDEDSLFLLSEDSKVLDEKKPVNIEDESIPQIDKIDKVPKDKEEFILSESCDIDKFYGEKETWFKIENLFSELVNDYQRAKARYNLGIAETDALVWGNITGAIENQQDLYAFVVNTLTTKLNNYTDIINSILVQWGLEIDFRLNGKADIFSPKFQGEPATTLPEIDDDSLRIAPTNWVNAKLALNESNTLKWIKLDKTYMFYGDSPQRVTLSWDYYNDIQEQYINGISINPLLRRYMFNNVSDSFIIHFSYKVNDKWYNQFLSFQKVHAYYFGTSYEIQDMTKSKDTLFDVVVPKDKYAYIYIPSDSNARLSVDNLYGGFKIMGNTLLNGINYYLYRTVNSGLGELRIKYDKQ